MGVSRSKPPAIAAVAPAAADAGEGEIPSMWDDEPDVSRTDQTGLIVPKSVRSAKRPALMVMGGGSAGKVLLIKTDRLRIGRSKEAGLVLTDQGISRFHCEIVCKNNTYTIHDLASTNGTFVNGERTNTCELGPGDRVQLGPDAVLQFDFYDEAEEGVANSLYEAATRDPLTRALNRRAFQDRLLAEVAYAARHRENLVAVAIDIDHFKVINDTYGHPAGDVVLREVATKIATTLRGEDVFARIGGEEFVLLGRGLSLRNGLKMAERLRKLIEDQVFTSKARTFQVTISIGVAELGETGRQGSGEKLLELADGRLYAAKRGGRNRVVAKD